MFKKSLRNSLELEYDGDPLLPDFVVETVDRDSYPDIEIATDKIPGRHGEVFKKRRLGSRDIKFTIRAIEEGPWLYESARQALRETERRLRTYFNKNEPKKLILSDQPGLYDLAILSDMESELVNWSILFTVTMTVPEGFSRELTPIVIALKPGDNHYYYLGDLRTPFSIEATTTAENIVVDNLASDDRFIANGATIGASVEIDFDKETYTESGRLAMTKVPAMADFPWLVPGENLIKISGLENIIFSYEGRWL